MSAKLNERLNRGEPEAFSELFKQTHPRMMGYCRLFIVEKKEAEDIVQECFLHLWKHYEKIDLHKSVESLLFVSLRNRCLNYLKESTRFSFNRQYDDLESNELQYLYQLDFLDEKELSIEEQLVKALKIAIDELPDRKREILIKNKVEGIKQKAIAEELGISVKTVEKHLKEAKQELRIKLEKQFSTLTVILFLMLQ